MRFGTLKSMCVAAALAAMAVPAAAQGVRTNEGGTPASPNGARGAEGEAGTVRGNSGAAGGTVGGTVGGAVNRGVDGAAGVVREGTNAATGVVREGTNAAGRIVRDGANAAEDAATPDRPVAGNEGRMNQGRLGDAALARWLIADNEGEVRLGEVASQKSQNEDVKQFAQQMVNDHGKMVEQLQQVANRDAAGRANRTGAADGTDAAPAAGRRTANFPPNADAVERDAARDADRAARDADRADRNADAADRDAVGNDRANRDAGRPGLARQGGNNNAAVALHVQIKQNLTQTLAKELQSKNGAEFDKCYIGGQILAHQAELATLQAAQQFASADLKPMLSDATQDVQKHLDQAKQIMEQLEGQSRTNR